jgi:hypothetical protein
MTNLGWTWPHKCYADDIIQQCFDLSELVTIDWSPSCVMTLGQDGSRMDEAVKLVWICERRIKLVQEVVRPFSSAVWADKLLRPGHVGSVLKDSGMRQAWHYIIFFSHYVAPWSYSKLGISVVSQWSLYGLKVFWENFKKWYNSPKGGRISKIMVPPESMSQYLSNEYQYYGVSIEL